MNIDPAIQNKIEELQIFERNMQQLIVQKQSVQIELNEINNALEELKKAKKEVYKVAGSIMVLSDRESLTNELEEKRKVFDLKLVSVEKEESSLEKRIENIREEINKKIQKSEHQEK